MKVTGTADDTVDYGYGATDVDTLFSTTIVAVRNAIENLIANAREEDIKPGDLNHVEVTITMTKEQP